MPASFLIPNSSFLIIHSFRQNDLPFPHRRWGERDEQILPLAVDLDLVRAEGEEESICADGAVWEKAERSPAPQLLKGGDGVVRQRREQRLERAAIRHGACSTSKPTRMSLSLPGLKNS